VDGHWAGTNVESSNLLGEVFCRCVLHNQRKEIETADFFMLFKPSGVGYSLLCSKKQPPRHSYGTADTTV
jgi:hypothetical protein